MILPLSFGLFFFPNLSLTQLLCKVWAPFHRAVLSPGSQAAAKSAAVLLQASLSLLSLLIATAGAPHPLAIRTAHLLPTVPLALHYLKG